jgi:hypothetical protein
VEGVLRSVDADLVPSNALNRVPVGISVSESADLPRLGLDPKHAELAIGELTRAILIAGGRVVYGGGISPPGFTQMIMNEVRRYGSPGSLTICLAYTEYRGLPLEELRSVDRRLGAAGLLEYLDLSGNVVDLQADWAHEGQAVNHPRLRERALTGLRRHMTEITAARVVVGGRLSGFQGRIPGVLEEINLSVMSGQPLYVAGGFGGAAAAAVRSLGIDELQWAPDSFPTYDPNDSRVVDALQELHELATETSFGSLDNGLDFIEKAQLSATHRPGEIASLVAVGLSRHVRRSSNDERPNGHLG